MVVVVAMVVAGLTLDASSTTLQPLSMHCSTVSQSNTIMASNILARRSAFSCASRLAALASLMARDCRQETQQQLKKSVQHAPTLKCGVIDGEEDPCPGHAFENEGKDLPTYP